jgi:uncharacterized protein (DUF4415 family)
MKKKDKNRSEEIQVIFLDEEDTPLTEEELNNSQIINVNTILSKKKQMAISEAIWQKMYSPIDYEIINEFKSRGGNWREDLNGILRKWLERENSHETHNLGNG